MIQTEWTLESFFQFTNRTASKSVTFKIYPENKVFTQKVNKDAESLPMNKA